MAGWHPGAHDKLHRLQLHTALSSMHVKVSSVSNQLLTVSALLRHISVHA